MLQNKNAQTWRVVPLKAPINNCLFVLIQMTVTFELTQNVLNLYLFMYLFIFIFPYFKIFFLEINIFRFKKIQKVYIENSKDMVTDE